MGAPMGNKNASGSHSGRGKRKTTRTSSQRLREMMAKSRSKKRIAALQRLSGKKRRKTRSKKSEYLNWN